MGRTPGPPTKTITTPLARPTYECLKEQAQIRNLTVSSHIRGVLERLYPGTPSPLEILPPEPNDSPNMDK